MALLVYAQIDAVRAYLPSSTGPASFIPLFAGPFPDFTDQWAAVVGAQILTTVVLNAVVPFGRLIISVANRVICLPLITFRVGPAWTQRELNRRYEGDPFSLARRYGRLLNIVFGCLLLSSEMPVLLLAAAIIIAITEWIDRFAAPVFNILRVLFRSEAAPCIHIYRTFLKIFRLYFDAYSRVYLLRLCRLPPRHSHRLSDNALEMLDFAVVVHLCVGCWVFSATNSLGAPMFPRPASPAVDQADIALSVAGLAVAGAGNLNCTMRKTAELCTNGTARAFCQWDGAGLCSSLPAAQQQSAADPLGAAPRLLNGLVLPYLLITLVTVATVAFRHTPVWRVAKRSVACLCWCFVGRVSLESGVARRERPNYSVALNSGLFGNIPATYDLQKLHPYDEVDYLPSNQSPYSNSTTEYVYKVLAYDVN